MPITSERITSITDETGVVKTQYAYSPFGEPMMNGAASDNAFQYTGRENDGTGLTYYRYRYYNSALGRFISEDPIGLRGGVNYFRYAANNPLLYRDPLGLTNWGKVGTGTLAGLQGLGTFGFGVAVGIYGYGEIAEGFALGGPLGGLAMLYGLGNIGHIFGLSGMLGALGGGEVIFGVNMILDGLAEPDGGCH